MTAPTPRRTWVRRLMASAGLLACTAAALPAAAPARVDDIAPLADGVHWLPGRFERGRQPDGNSLLLQGRDGLVVVDSGRHVEHTQALLDWARARGLPLRAVVNTHWHLDHLGGNALLRRVQPALRSHASAAVRDAVARRMPTSEAELKAVLADPATDDTTRRMVEIDLALYAVRDALRPDVLIEGPARDVEIAGRRLRIGIEQGVSGGDVWVLDTASGILALGDFVTLPVPFLDTACASEWRAALGRLEALPFERVMPGHGPLMSRDEFRRYRRAFEGLLDCAAGSASVASCSAAWVADLGPLLPGTAQRSVGAMLEYYLGQHLRAAAPDRDRFCAR